MTEDEVAILAQFKESGRWEYHAGSFGGMLMGPEILAMTQEERDAMVRMIRYGWKMLEDHSWFKAFKQKGKT